MKKVVCVGSVNVDTLLFVDKLAEEDGEQTIIRKEIYSGGQAGNIAHGLGVLGKQVFFFGDIGNDSHTEMLLKDFSNAGVNYSFAQRKNGANNYVYSIIDKKGARSMYAYNEIKFSANDFADELYKDTAFIIFSSIIKDDVIEIYSKIAIKAKERGIKIALDPGNILASLGFEKLRPLLDLCDYFLPSLSEINLLVGELENIEKLSRIVPNIIVKCGENGSKLFKDGEEHFIPTNKLDNIIDTTGAGDCYTAAFISSLIDGKSEKEAAIYATRAASISIMRKGARSMPLPGEIEEFSKK